MKLAASLAAMAAAVILSLVVNAGLFSFLPAMGYWRMHQGKGPEDRARETQLVPLPMIPKKKEKPKARESERPTPKKAAEPGKAIARQRFVMDLGAAGGTGAAVDGGAMARSDLQQVAFAEGETDVDAQAINRPEPVMPKEAEKAGVRGLARCILTIGEDGSVVDVEILEVPGKNLGFEEAVREAARKSRFKPAMMGGIPVRQRFEQGYQF